MLRAPWLLLPFLAGASSIGSLLLYFAGTLPFGVAVRGVLLPGVALGVAFVVWARRSGRRALAERVLAGVWAGALATLAYDIVRVPLVHGGLPVFQAISYFGTVALGQTHPTLASELVGWSYHLSNGIGFAVMYACLVRRPHWTTAVLWGLALEGAMLATPYAEVFGYTRSATFTAITLGAHVVYGLVLWLALRLWAAPFEKAGAPREASRRRPSPRALAAGLGAAAAGIALVAGDFHRGHAETLPPSPPPRMGPHLYVTWDALEVDRVVAMWLLRRHVDPEARFHFVAPFSSFSGGVPFDTPESAFRRSGSRSTTEVLLEERGLDADPVLARLGRVAHHFEIAPWIPSRDPDVQGFGRELEAEARACRPVEEPGCVEALFARLDAWSERERRAAAER